MSGIVLLSEVISLFSQGGSSREMDGSCVTVLNGNTDNTVHSFKSTFGLTVICVNGCQQYHYAVQHKPPYNRDRN